AGADRRPEETIEEAARRAAAEPGVGVVRLGAERRTIRYGVMHYKIRLFCFDAVLPGPRALPPAPWEWRRPDELAGLPFGTAQRTLAADVAAQPAPAA
ncbi:MAG: hypothetical protein ACRDD1_09525, partial [Planctomycetia bacterium]